MTAAKSIWVTCGFLSCLVAWNFSLAQPANAITASQVDTGLSFLQTKVPAGHDAEFVDFRSRLLTAAADLAMPTPAQLTEFEQGLPSLPPGTTLSAPVKRSLVMVAYVSKKKGIKLDAAIQGSWPFPFSWLFGQSA